MADLQSFSSPYANLQNGQPDIGKFLGLVQTLQGVQDFQAKQAVGKAYQDSTDPQTGLVDTGKFMGLIKSNPEAALRASEAAKSAADLQGAYINNNTGALNLSAGQTKFAADLIGSYADKKGGVTDRDIAEMRTILARNGIPMSLTEGILGGTRPAQEKFQDMQNFAMGPNGRAATGPNTVVPSGPNKGATFTPTMGQFVRQATTPATAAAPAGVPGVMTGLPPGGATQIEDPKKAYLADQERSATIQGGLRKLEAAYPLIQQLSSVNFGPGSDRYAQAKAGLITLGIIDPNTSDATLRQEVNKYLKSYARDAQGAGRSDHSLDAALSSNPSLDLTQPANLNLTRNQIGFDKADAAMPILFDQSNPGDQSKQDYKAFKANYYRDYDQRAFIYDKMSPEERRQLIDSLGAKNSAAYKKFAKTYSEIKSAHFVLPTTGQ